MPESPNILLLMTDQQRFDTIAAAGYEHMITPNLDRLAREGCLFRSAYTPNPICMPARHHTLSGTTGRAHGVFNNTQQPMDPAVPTLPRLLSDSGYETRAIGKMHFQPRRRHHGFDRMELMEEHPTYREHDEYAMYLKSVGYGHIQNLHGIRNLIYEAPQRSLVPEQHHGSTWVADRTIDFLRTNRGRQPFFCWSSWIAPHPPFNVPHSVADLYCDRQLPQPHQSITERNEFTLIGGKGVEPPPGEEHAFHRRRREAYYAQITYVDQQIGRIYQALEQTGLLDNTLIMFTSDHGEMLWDHGAIQKGHMYEGATHIPLIMRYPPAVTPGSVRDEFVDLNDILPTALDVAGVEHPQPDQLPGASVLGEGKDRSIQYLSLGTRGRRWACVRDARFKYTYYYGLDHEELFDMINDPGETTNLLETSPDQAEVADAKRRLHNLVVEHERKWGPADYVDEHGRLRRFETPDHGSSGPQRLAARFPNFPSNIMDPDEYAALNSFAAEAVEATRDEPLVRLHQHDLSAWRQQGASEAFLEWIRREGL